MQGLKSTLVSQRINQFLTSTVVTTEKIGSSRVRASGVQGCTRGQDSRLSISHILIWWLHSAIEDITKSHNTTVTIPKVVWTFGFLTAGNANPVKIILKLTPFTFKWPLLQTSCRAWLVKLYEFWPKHMSCPWRSTLYTVYLHRALLVTFAQFQNGWSRTPATAKGPHRYNIPFYHSKIFNVRLIQMVRFYKTTNSYHNSVQQLDHFQQSTVTKKLVNMQDQSPHPFVGSQCLQWWIIKNLLTEAPVPQKSVLTAQICSLAYENNSNCSNW